MAASVQFEHSFAGVNGAQLHYESGGHGPPLLLIHARIADSRMWYDNVQALATDYTAAGSAQRLVDTAL